MKKYCIYLLIIFVIIVSGAMPACRQAAPPDVSIHSYPTRGDSESAAAAPTGIAPSATGGGKEYVERNIIVDDKNNIFSIGIPAGFTEKTEITAQDSIDYWFEYLSADAELEVDGVVLQRNPFSWETKVKYTQGVKKFDYRINNTTGQAIAYNLHLIPSMAGTSVLVAIKQRWMR